MNATTPPVAFTVAETSANCANIAKYVALQ